MKKVPLNYSLSEEIEIRQETDVVNMNDYENIIPEELNVPELIKKLVLILKSHYKGISINIILSIVIAKLAQAITTLRIQYKEHLNFGFPNYYAMIFMPSGFGKDKMVSDIDKFFLCQFHKWFKEQADKFKQKRYESIEQEAQEKYPNVKQEKRRRIFIEEERKKVRNLIIELSDGTREGFYSDAAAFAQADFGGIFLRISELGLFLRNASNEQMKFLDLTYEAYNGKIYSKSIKGENRKNTIEGVPVNIILYSDPTLFKGELKKIFSSYMETGLARRCVVSFQLKKEAYAIEQNGQKAFFANEKYQNDLKKVGFEFFRLFENLTKNVFYELTVTAYTKGFHDYIKKLEIDVDAEENSLLKKEIASREFKVLKLSALYACLNHSNDRSLNETDIKQAIYTIEKLSQDFKDFLNYKPKYKDKYDCGFNFFLKNINQYFTKTELVNRYYQEFGLSRDKFRNQFDDYIEAIEEIASLKGYVIRKTSINRNSGNCYALIPVQEKTLSDEVMSLENLID